ncbi:MAG: endopeptidase La [Clostridia bacterium]|nr:endopeptidase La [Clostridia bacterium]
MAKYNEMCESFSMPLVPLMGAVFAFPNISITVDISNPVLKNAVEVAEKTDSFVFLVSQKNPFAEKIEISNLFNVGVIAKVKQVTKKGPKSILASFEGVCRAEHTSIHSSGTFYMASVVAKRLEITDFDKAEHDAYLRVLSTKAKAAISMFASPSSDMLMQFDVIDDLDFLSDLCGALILTRTEDKYAILAEYDMFKRTQLAIELMDKEIKVVKLEGAIKRKTNAKIDESQREYYLREQLKIIQGELGNDAQSESEELYEQIMSKHFPKAVEEKLLKELTKFNKAPFGSPESAVLRTYIETCLEIPFEKFSNDETSVANARKVLERDHYGLEKVKERILEFIAVKEINPEVKNQIICLVGPPGVGKTSLCASIAKALKRKYVRVSLGGIRDEADIRGHRKTYVGAMPGRIINALCECKTANPVMVLDEIDKMTSDSRGDPASAMLEVLDSEQNKSFRDHFVEMSIDLSRCMFIATANTLDSIPAPLIDRMEIIELSSYTRNEKLHIAKNHLLGKQLKLHGLNKRMLKLSDDAIYKIIDSYTAEAGVRGLERVIASLCRKCAKEIIENKVKSVSIDALTLQKYLGVEKYESEKIDPDNQIGVVNGMAYTSIGGDLLKIEATVMKGNGKLQLTGKLGEVMRESCEIAVSFIRENAEALGIDPDFYANSDIHIHVPEGAVPKDGPSAGVTITTALVSILSNRPVKRDIAMTGEITLRGKVLPIGGLKEKTLAAYSGGVTNIIIPKKNEKDLEDIDKTVRENVHFIPCSSIFEVLDAAFADEEVIAIFSNNVPSLVGNENKCKQCGAKN